MARVPSVVISYSWDSPAHRSWVRRLASRLVRNGVKVWLDQWHVKPGESLTAFMEQKIASSGHVLIICTPAYATKANRRRGGVGYEQQIVSGRIAAGIPRRKFIPILRSGRIGPGRDCAVPTHFAGIFVLDMRTRNAQRTSFEQLLRSIFNKPKFAPPTLGFTPFALKQALAKVPMIRLPDMELDGWRLASGVASNQRAPKTFWIPSESVRRNVKRGDFVKLIFEYSEEDAAAERMWVKVTGVQGPYFIGKLRNRPIFSSGKLRSGSRVIFLPEHIIDITN
jgi:hypothetical protein